MIEEIKKVLTVKSLAVGIALIIFNTVFQIIAMPGIHASYKHLPWAFFYLYIILLLVPLLKLSAQELAVTYAMILVTILIPTAYGFPHVLSIMPGAILNGEPYITEALKFVPSLFAPKDLGLLDGFLHGGAAVPWSVWLGPIFYWFALIFLWYMAQTFFSLLISPLWIEIERLEFPYASSASMLIREGTTSASKRTSLLRNKLLHIGILLAVFLQLPPVVKIFVPAFPSWGLPAAAVKLFDPTPMVAGVLPWSFLIVYCTDFFIAGAYLLPLETMFSTIFFWLVIGVIFPPILYSMGYMPSPVITDGWSVWFTHLLAPNWYPMMIKELAFECIYWGSILGLGIWPLIFQWRYIRDVVKSLFTKQTEVKAGAPLPHRWALPGFIVCFVLVLGLTTASGMTWWAAIILLIILQIAMSGSARARAESGGMLGYIYQPNSWALGMLGDFNMWGGVAGTTQGATNWIVGGELIWQGPDSGFMSPAVTPPGTTMEALKVGDATKTSRDASFIAVVISTAFALAIGIPLYLIFAYSLGTQVGMSPWSGWCTGNWLGGWYTLIAKLGNEWGAWLAWKPFSQGGLGITIWFVLVGVLYFLRARYPRFPLHPIGLLLLAGSIDFVYVFIIALALKWLTIKIGGASLYEKKGVPLAVGFIIGYGLMMFVSTALQLIHFRIA